MDNKSSHQNARRGRGRHYPQDQPHKEREPNHDLTRVPILKWDPNITRNNFHSWRERLLVYSHIIETNTNLDIPDVPVPTGGKLSDVEKINYEFDLNSTHVPKETVKVK